MTREEAENILARVVGDATRPSHTDIREACRYALNALNEPSLPSEISLEKFIEKMDDWKARFDYPDRIPIKATMAFTARMFYMYPNVAREWYESLPKATQD